MASVDGQPAVFDPAVYYGHSEAEFGMSWCAGFGPEFYDAYFEELPKQPGFETRRDLYLVYHYLVRNDEVWRYALCTLATLIHARSTGYEQRNHILVYALSAPSSSVLAAVTCTCTRLCDLQSDAAVNRNYIAANTDAAVCCKATQGCIATPWMPAQSDAAVCACATAHPCAEPLQPVRIWLPQ